MIGQPLPILETAPHPEIKTPDEPWRALAAAVARQADLDSGPRVPQIHLVRGGGVDQLLVVNGTRLYDLPHETTAEFRRAIDVNDHGTIETALTKLGLQSPAAIDDDPLVDPPTQALSLAIAQKCNLGCSYCYAQQGAFGGTPKNMSLETAIHAIDLLFDGCTPGGNVTLAFLGGEPLVNRAVLRQATQYAAAKSAQMGIGLNCSVTTNGTLLTEDDAEFFEEHRFAVTVSLDGARHDHDQLRPFKSGAGSFDHIVARIRPLLQMQRRMQVSARVTVTPRNMSLVETLDEFISMGFHSVGFSPLLRSTDGKDEMAADHLQSMLEEMIACGLSFERHVLAGKRYPFLNMVNALRELHRGTHRPYPCGAGAGYFGVSASGDLAACHRFVEAPEGKMGSVEAGIDRTLQNRWLATRHVHVQQPCNGCWARYLCGGGCHHEVLAGGRVACDFIRGWLHYTIQAYGRLNRLIPNWFRAPAEPLHADRF